MSSICEKIKKSKHFWIYGAGVIADRVLEFLDNPILDVRIDGIIVSDLKNNPHELRGYQVCGLENLDVAAQDTFILIAVSEKNQIEIAEALTDKGYCHMACWGKSIQLELWGLAKTYFENRKKNYQKVCFVLSGYKQFLWDEVFTRLKKFCPDDVEVCILSSGVYAEELSDIALKNDWSYLSTVVNSVTLIQNIAIGLFDQAEMIYKMDEDIFVTEGCFEKTVKAMRRVEEREYFRVGFAAPLINVNGYGYLKLLQRFNLTGDYEKRFEHPLYGGNEERQIENNPKTALYMWGIDSSIPQLDVLNTFLQGEDKYGICSVRFSIGFILFRRDFWEDLGGFDVSGLPDMGKDEIQMGQICMKKSYAIAVAEDTVVGHFSFGRQTEAMKEYYKEHPEWFAIQEQ